MLYPIPEYVLLVSILKQLAIIVLLEISGLKIDAFTMCVVQYVTAFILYYTLLKNIIVFYDFMCFSLIIF